MKEGMYKYLLWSQLYGVKVEVRRNGQALRVGRVEAAMSDNSALWLAAEGVEGRALLQAAEGYEIWVESTLYLALVQNYQHRKKQVSLT